MRVLDVGSGRRPTIPPEDRPADCFYVGLDVSVGELALAPEGSYDETVVSSVAAPLERMENSFDLIVSFQVLEHVRPLEPALDALRSYLRPGGHLVAFFSGRYSVFALASMLIPARASSRIVSWLMRCDPEKVFPAYYDGCYASDLRRMLAGWSDVQLESHWGAAVYFDRAPALQRIYVAYEEWARRSSRDDLATHYLLVAAR